MKTKSRSQARRALGSAGLMLLSSILGGGLSPARACVGDCRTDGAVTVDELLQGVNIVLGITPLDSCSSFDDNADGRVTVDELVTAVNNALGGCVPSVTPISTATATPSSTGTSSGMATPSTTPTPSVAPSGTSSPASLTYPIVDTGQSDCYDDSRKIPCPQRGDNFHGQDAQYAGNAPRYQDNGDGTITDLNTGLMWQTGFGEKVSFDDALADAETFRLAGYDDWRLPSIKELYSLIDFRGLDPSGWNGNDTSGLVPFIDTNYFDFEYGDTSAGERIIDAQYWSATEYVSTTMGGDATTFGVNFADGRIKGYGRTNPRGDEMTQFTRYVRDNPDYGVNDFRDNADGTITDLATGLMWMQADSGIPYDWQGALAYAENLRLAGQDDWRLPNAKELQSILDYTRSPATSGSAAIDPIFAATPITDEGGGPDYPFYWSSTTHANWTQSPGRFAAYIAFGEALGFMEMPPLSGNRVLLDVHGAGAQRSDPKTGDPADWPNGNGPQGDVVRIYNYVRCVRDVN